MKNLYLIVFYLKQPKDPRKTHLSGYMNQDGNFSYTENLTVSTKIKPRDLEQASIILNLAERKTVVNRLNPDATFDQTMAYYLTHYANYLSRLGVTKEWFDEPNVQSIQTEEKAQS